VFTEQELIKFEEEPTKLLVSPTKAEAFAQWLVTKEITHAFGIIGGGNAPLWDAIARLEKTRLICVHQEQAAAMAAAYYYRTSRRLALTLVTTGAGSTNVVTGVMAAWMDSIPLLVVSGNEASKYHEDGGRGFGFQGYKSWRVAQHFTKLAKPLHLQDLDDDLAFALKPRQGPIWLDFPKDSQSALA